VSRVRNESLYKVPITTASGDLVCNITVSEIVVNLNRFYVGTIIGEHKHDDLFAGGGGCQLMLGGFFVPQM
jgi:hypothetical protein